MRRGVYRTLFPTLLALSALAAAGPAAAAGAPEHVPGELVVRFVADADATERKGVVAKRRGRIAAALRLSRAHLVRVPAGTSVTAAAAALERDPAVEFAEPNYVYRLTARPNDPRFAELWGLDNSGNRDIDAPEAWELTTGSRDVVVAVIDTGVAYGHADLAPNLWTNAREIAGNGVDDDGNGRVDDTVGWDFVGGDGTPLDENGHGTHVAGTIGARGNNGVGVVGVNWAVGLMALRAGDAEGSFTNRAIADAIAYACANGARVVNGSFGGPGQSLAVNAAMTSSACARTLFVYAAGNEGANNDATPMYPCNAPLEAVVCVAATDSSDALAGYSNRGPVNVDVAAPGSGIVSTWHTGGYQRLNGTSMAAPHVAGAAALLLARNPALTPAELRATILDTADRLPSLTGLVASGGRLNARAAVAAVPAPVAAETPTSPDPTPAAPAPAPTPTPPPVTTPPPAPAPAPRCVVPKLRGKTVAGARTRLRARSCRLGRVTYAYASAVRKGRIVRQSARAGRTLKRGAKVAVVVSRGARR